MIDCQSYWYHFRTHKTKYIIFGFQFIMLLFGIVFMAVGNHEERSTMFAFGVLFLMGSIIWFGGYIGMIFCCPDVNMCCEEPDWENFGDIEY